MDYKALKNYQNSNHNYFNNIGIKVTDLSLGYAVSKLTTKPENFNTKNKVSASVIFALLSSASETVALSYGNDIQLINSDCQYFKSINSELTIYAIARTVKHGQNFTVVNVKLKDLKSNVYAVANFSYLNQ